VAITGPASPAGHRPVGEHHGQPVRAPRDRATRTQDPRSWSGPAFRGDVRFTQDAHPQPPGDGGKSPA